jgi:hypothetical protein
MLIYSLGTVRVEREIDSYFVHHAGSDDGAFYDSRAEAIQGAIDAVRPAARIAIDAAQAARREARV